MALNIRISSFAALGALLEHYTSQSKDITGSWELRIDEAVQQSERYNPWFTREHQQLALRNIAVLLQKETLEQWIKPYVERINACSEKKRIGIVMAGNIPAVGFHDLLCVLICGYSAIVKCSSQDRFLIPVFADFLKAHDPWFASTIEFTEGQISGFDAVIATGSNNSSRYFESYFSSVPHIIRKNRNSAAVLSGMESPESLSALCDDIFQYFGLGCRNVSRVFVPVGYSFDPLLRAAERYFSFADHHKYSSNYIYYRTIFMMNSDPFWENGVVLLRKADEWGSPVSVLYYTEYSDIIDVNNMLDADKDKVQCVVSELAGINGSQPFGSTQRPALGDYADGIDTMAFLCELIK